MNVDEGTNAHFLCGYCHHEEVVVESVSCLAARPHIVRLL